MAQNHCPSIDVFESLLYFLSYVVTHAAKPCVSKLVYSATINDLFAPLWFGAFSGDNYAEVPTAFLPLPDVFADFFNVEGLLRNQDDVCASGNPCLQGDPTGVSTHNFKDYHSVMRFCRCMKPVKCFASNCNRRLKTKGIVRANQVVVDCFGDSDDGKPHFVQLVGYAKRVLSAYCDDRFNAVFGNVSQNTLCPISALERIGPRRA